MGRDLDELGTDPLGLLAEPHEFAGAYRLIPHRDRHCPSALSTAEPATATGSFDREGGEVAGHVWGKLDGAVAKGCVEGSGTEGHGNARLAASLAAPLLWPRIGC
jgi:hypothetical protein